LLKQERLNSRRKGLYFNKNLIMFIPISQPSITQKEIDYVNELGGSYLKIVNPVQTSSCGCGSSFGV
jgi:Fe-S cluster assembly iron-binding protein IscA